MNQPPPQPPPPPQGYPPQYGQAPPHGYAPQYGYGPPVTGFAQGQPIPKAAPGPNMPLVVLITLGIIVAVFAGFGILIFAIAHQPSKPNTVVFDNRLPGAASVEVDGEKVADLEPRGSDKAVASVNLTDGSHRFRLIGGKGAVIEERKLEISRAFLVWSVGAKTKYAVASVHYRVRGQTNDEPDVAHLLVTKDQVLWQADIFRSIEATIDEPFPQSIQSHAYALRHVCRVVGDAPQCEGGPDGLTDHEPYRGLAQGD